MATEEKRSKVYEAGCHCGQITFSMKLSPPLEEGYEVLNCNCSICRRSGYLLVYPAYEDVTWHGNSKENLKIYRFNTKKKDQLFCDKCGSSIGIDFVHQEPRNYGISVRTVNGVDLDALTYDKLDGVNKVQPVGDLSGVEHVGK